MRFPRILVAAAAVVCCAVAWAGPAATIRQPVFIPAGKTLTLDECIDLALKNQPSVRQAAAALEAQKGVVSQARSRLLPGTSVTASTILAGDTGSTGTSANISADQLIHDFGRSRSQLTQAEHQEAAGLESLGGAKADTILVVKQDYYAKLRADHLVDVFTENLKAQDEHVASAGARHDSGLAPLADVLKAQAASASARVDLVTARNAADQARVDLNAAMGVDIRSPILIAETSEPEAPVPDEDQAVKLAMERRPEIRRDTDQMTASEAAVKTAQTGNLPALTTALNQSISTGGGQFGTPNSWSWFLDLSWSPYDSGLTSGSIKQAQAELVFAQETLYNTRQSVEHDVVQARLNVIAAGEQLTAAIAEVASAREDLAAASGRYEAGVGILLEVLDAQAALLKAEVDEFTGRYGLSIARAGLEHATGGTAKKGGGI